MAKTSDRTKALRKKKNVFAALSYGLFIASACFFIIYGLCTLDLPSSTGSFLSEDAKAAVVGVSTTGIICIVGSIIIKDKIRTFMWMVTLIMGVMCFNQVGMCIVLGLWLIDEYVFHMLYKRYKRLLEINKEIDKR